MINSTNKKKHLKVGVLTHQNLNAYIICIDIVDF